MRVIIANVSESRSGLYISSRSWIMGLLESVGDLVPLDSSASRWEKKIIIQEVLHPTRVLGSIHNRITPHTRATYDMSGYPTSDSPLQCLSLGGLSIGERHLVLQLSFLQY